jgi:hypothetical protein
MSIRRVHLEYLAVDDIKIDLTEINCEVVTLTSLLVKFNGGHI